ncbi:hypothetical protein TGCAST_390070 [Toxoplasma gondii CAST]|uniref:Uncharacterized protein n=2 Tax=Toxoplasma gondii TaxID=5811 RepID=A0A3R8AWD7_TOXGO|nr:hypothetical protein TGCAST_390070 [Toxoplasma gondii CAST]
MPGQCPSSPHLSSTALIVTASSPQTKCLPPDHKKRQQLNRSVCYISRRQSLRPTKRKNHGCATRQTNTQPASTTRTSTSRSTNMSRVYSPHVFSSSPPTPHRPPLMQTKPDPLETQRNSRPPDPSVVRRALTDCSQRKNTKHSDESNRPQPCHHPRLPTYFRRIPQAATPLTAITRHRSVAGTPSPRH